MTSLPKMPSLSVRLIMVMVFFSRGTLTTALCQASTSVNTDCVASIAQLENCNFQVEIYEDCPTGSDLFTIEGTSVSIAPCENMFAGNGATVVLSGQLNAETTRSYSCSRTITVDDGSQYSALYSVLDVDEFPPSLLNQDPSVTLYQEENNAPGSELLSIKLSDDDYGETQTMQAQLHATVEDTFAIQQSSVCNDASCSEIDFSLIISKSLDYESGVFYELNIDFTTTDTRGGSSSTAIKVLLFLNDTSDSPPFWLRIVPSASFEESNTMVDNIAYVEARDRDTAVNHDICYRIDGGNDEGYFTIGEKTGVLSCPSGIDREALSQTSFQLDLMALEVLGGDCINVADLPNNVTQMISLQVLDVNDNSPEFNEPHLAITMSELTSGDQLTSGNFTVTDLDEGSAGQYSLVSDDTVHLGFNSDSGSGVTNFVIKAIYDNQNNIFDYEKMTGGNYDITFQVVATEVADAAHTNTMAVTITLEDVNDINPVFEEESYNVSLPENSVPGTSVITVSATDGDTSPEFGTPSIRYFLTQCDAYFTIDAETGEITVSGESVLDYEQTEQISCSLEARDREAVSPYLSAASSLTVTLADVDDTPPILTAQDATVSEGEEVSSVITSVSVRDVDTQATVSFAIQYDVGTADAVQGWFSIKPRDCTLGDNFGQFCADLVVDSALDRELQADVHLTIVATDNNTDVNDASDSSEIVITLEDVNDVAPSFCGDYEDSLSVYENEPQGTVIAQICATDPDIGDVLAFSVSNSTQITIDPDTGVLSVYTKLDRETDPKITVTITVTDAASHTSDVEATIVVKDRNDNSPQPSEPPCETAYVVMEDAVNGTEIVVATASDDDEGAHAEVSYALRNAEAGSPFIPFSVDSVSGSIAVFIDLDNRIYLDREEKGEWLLLLQAYDGCEPDETSCSSRVTSCPITMTVGDVNDNAPYLASDKLIYAGEELLKDEEVPDYAITAQDKDLRNTSATEIHYLVTEFLNLETGVAEELAFKAVDFNEIDGSGYMQWSCTLYTTKDLMHMAGWYNLTLQAKDGPPEGPGNVADLVISIKITDANDYTPVIDMGPAISNTSQHVEISEEMYAGGDCIPVYDEGPPVEMKYIDLDAEEPNNLATITVDYNNSVVYSEDDAAGQLNYFEMVNPSLDKWHLCLKAGSANLSLESAQAYNLSLKVEDKGTPPLFSHDWIFLNLTAVSEFPPNFGKNVSDCYATTYILEETTNTGVFRAAEDEDNAGGVYDTIYYHIVGGEESKFTIPDSIVPEVRPYNLLDRDDGPGQYTILIRATNTNQDPPDVGGVVPTSTDMLQLTIVLMDQNDNAPTFNSTLFYGSVLQSGSTDQLAAVLVAVDKDLNETLYYERVTDLMWEPDENYGEDVFEVLDDTELGYVWLRQDPKSLSGYCLFTARVSDRISDHWDEAKVQIFIVESSDEVPFSFKNDIATLQEAQDDIEMILSATFGYKAFIDSMSTKSGSDNTTRDSVVEVHFVNSSRTAREATPGNIVPPYIIESMASSAVTSAQLQSDMADIGLELYQVGSAQLDEGNSLEAQLLTYQIALGVVSIVLLSIAFLVSTAYCVRTRKLERRVKVLSTNTFGSQSSDLNKTGVAAAPNSNLFKGEGTNPMFNISLQEFNNQDTGSISSGDSVLVGVEDNPEFRDYKADQGRSSKGDAPGFVGADGIASNNPLFSVQPSAPARSIDGSDAGSYQDGDLGTPNPNFMYQ